MLLGNRAKTCDFSSAGSTFCKLEPGRSPLRSGIPAFRKRNAFFRCLFVCLFVLRNPKSWALVSGVQLKDSKIPLSTGIRDPLSQEPIWNLANSQNGIQYPRLSWIQLYMGQGLFQERENNVRVDKTIVRLRHPGRGLKRAGGGGGVKNFFS